jgi:hypothetical protein
MEDVSIFYGHLVNLCTAYWYILLPFSIFYCHLVYIIAIWYIILSFGLFMYGLLVYLISIWYILFPFGIFYFHLVYFIAIWYIFGHLVYLSRFGVFYHEKSGNPACVVERMCSRESLCLSCI